MKTLVITEKPSVAKDIANILGSFRKAEGYLENEKYIVSWAVGHLVELAQPEDYDPKYKKWKLETLPIIPQSFISQPIKSSLKQLQILKEVINNNQVTTIINACDAGREGELIFRRIYNYCECDKPTKRLWLSETTPSAVQKAFNCLLEGSEKDDLASAAEARAQADWLVGINATRVFTVKNNSILSLGRVQTPTLALIVNREKEILSFNTEPFWEISGEFLTNKGETYTGKLTIDNSTRIESEALTKDICSKLSDKGKITDLEIKENTVYAPQLFNLNELQKACNKKFGYTAQATLDIAQGLYEKHKLITYPRTDSRYLTQAIVKETIKNRINALSKTADYSSLCSNVSLKETKWDNYVNDKKVTDHHAIIPTEATKTAGLNEKEKKVYDLIVRRFLSIFYPPYKFKTVKLTTGVDEYFFISKGKVNISMGWKQVQAEAEEKEDEEIQALPDLQKDDLVQLKYHEFQKKETKPPARYTEASLLSAMENAGKIAESKENAKILREAKGIGTPATRASVIEKLIKVQYIERKKKTLLPTTKGITLIGMVPDMIKSVEMTAEWELGLSQIEHKEKNAVQWLDGIKEFTSQLVSFAKELKKSELGGEKVVNFNREIIGKCPLCGKNIIEGKKGYGCIGFREGCNFVIWKEVAQKNIGKNAAQQLLKKGRTDVIKGFKSDDGKDFEGILILENNEVKFAN